VAQNIHVWRHLQIGTLEVAKLFIGAMVGGIDDHI
jgi:hypothetical protein